MGYQDEKWIKIHSSNLMVGDIISHDPHPESKYIVVEIDRYLNTYYGRLLTNSSNCKEYRFYLGPPFWFFKLIEEVE